MPGLFSGLRHPISSARAGRAGAGTFGRNFSTRGTRYAIGAARRRIPECPVLHGARNRAIMARGGKRVAMRSRCWLRHRWNEK